MLKNTEYDKVRLLHDLCRIEWFLDKHVSKDAQENKEFTSLCKNLQNDISNYVDRFKKIIT